MREPFKVKYQDAECQVEQMDIKGAEIYRVTIGNRIVILTKAERQNGKSFWTSVPEGDQSLAERLGLLIDAHVDNLLF